MKLCLVAVVRCGSFANAARSLDLSQSVASRAVARLEKRLGVRVLNRTTRSVSLTDDGRTLFERLEPLLEGFQNAFTSVVEERSRVRGRLRVKLHPTLAHVIKGKKLRAFLENYPELSVEFISSDKLGDLVGEGLDIALYVGELPSSSLIARSFWTRASSRSQRPGTSQSTQRCLIPAIFLPANTRSSTIATQKQAERSNGNIIAAGRS